MGLIGKMIVYGAVKSTLGVVADTVERISAANEKAAIAQNKKIKIPKSHSFYVGKPVEEVFDDFVALGFHDISLDKKKPGLFKKEGDVHSISVNSVDDFSSGYTVKESAKIRITYYKK